MKIYLGGHSYTHKHVRKKHYLLSYFYIGKKERGLIPKLAPLFLDSGAFSAWRRGSIINIKEYMAFIREYEKYLGVYANLDVIGDDKATMDNQRIMESEGLKPLPTYHRSEDEYYLERYLETHSHIALGGMVGDTPTVLADWLDRVWDNYLLRSDGTPKVKVHGFGVTSLRILKRYPWYSVDSTSWQAFARYGVVYTPKWKDGRWDYLHENGATMVATSEKSTKNIDPKSKHIDVLPSVTREQVFRYFEEKGCKFGDKEENSLMNSTPEREKLNITYFLDLEEALGKYPHMKRIPKAKGFSFDKNT